MTILSDSEKSRLQEIISKTTGPAPWYWKNFPVVTSASGKEYEWVHHGEEGQLAHLVTLHETGKTNDPLLALNIYCTPFEIGEGRFGIWCPDGRNMLRVVAFELEGLKPFVFEEIVGWFKQSTERIFAKVEPSADFEFSAELNEGMQELSVPELLRGVKELPMIARRGATGEDGSGVRRLHSVSACGAGGGASAALVQSQGVRCRAAVDHAVDARSGVAPDHRRWREDSGVPTERRRA